MPRRPTGHTSQANTVSRWRRVEADERRLCIFFSKKGAKKCGRAPTRRPRVPLHKKKAHTPKVDMRPQRGQGVVKKERLECIKTYRQTTSRAALDNISRLRLVSLLLSPVKGALVRRHLQQHLSERAAPLPNVFFFFNLSPQQLSLAVLLNIIIVILFTLEIFYGQSAMKLTHGQGTTNSAQPIKQSTVLLGYTP